MGMSTSRYSVGSSEYDGCVTPDNKFGSGAQHESVPAPSSEESLKAAVASLEADEEDRAEMHAVVELMVRLRPEER